MKELQHIQQDKETAAHHRPVLKQKFVDQLFPYPGQKCFEINITTGSITEAEYETISYDIKTGAMSRKVIIKENCRYVCAINIANAQRKAFKHLSGLK